MGFAWQRLPFSLILQTPILAMVFKVELIFHGNLPGFLPKEFQADGIICRELGEKTAVKDVIEACGVPHPEVDLIVAQPAVLGPMQAIDFTWQVQSPVRLDVYPVPAPKKVLAEAPRLQVPEFTRFVADGHLGKLARNLRLLGVDTLYERDVDDPVLLGIMAEENRALLTRDRRLLMHSVVRHGYCPRSPDPFVQTREVIERFHLRQSAGAVVPYCRCLRCNGLLQTVPKKEVIPALSAEPLTLRYYHEFQKCAQCGRIYWKGTHFERLSKRVGELVAL
jgi:uncharacterized protein with PIN domain